MLTASGVNFQPAGPSHWRAVLPEGPYLPCPVVVERGERGVTAHLEDTDQVFLCRQEGDGRIRIGLNGENGVDAFFHPETLEYGIALSARTESFAANGDWHFTFDDLRVVETTDGQVTARAGRHELTATTWPDRITVGPRPFLMALRKQGLGAALRGTVAFNSFLFRANGWKDTLFPDLVSARQVQEQKREERRRVAEVRQLATPPATISGVEVSETSVQVGAIRLGRRSNP